MAWSSNASFFTEAENMIGLFSEESYSDEAKTIKVANGVMAAIIMKESHMDVAYIDKYQFETCQSQSCKLANGFDDQTRQRTQALYDSQSVLTSTPQVLAEYPVFVFETSESEEAYKAHLTSMVINFDHRNPIAVVLQLQSKFLL